MLQHANELELVLGGKRESLVHIRQRLFGKVERGKGTFFEAFSVNVCFLLLQGRGLQDLIEQAYLDYLKHGKVREEFKFKTAEHKYKLFFTSTGMYQVNLKTGTKRRVRRRPGKVISNEDMEDLKWYE